MLQYDFEESLGYWIALTHQAYMRAFNERLAPFGISYRQAQVLGWLAVEGPLSQAELAARMLIEPPSLVGVLNRMEEAKLIARRACPDDARKNLIHPLRAADRIWERIADCGRDVREQAISGLTPREVETLRKLLRKVLQNVSPVETALV